MRKGVMRSKIHHYYKNDIKIKVQAKPLEKKYWCQHSYMIPHTSYTPYFIQDLLLEYPTMVVRMIPDKGYEVFINHLD